MLKQDGKIDSKKVFIEAAAHWLKLNEFQRAKYVEMNAKDKERKAKQLADLQSKGYFVLEDGSKSTDDKNKPKLTGWKVKKTHQSPLAQEDEVTVARKSLKKNPFL